MSFAYDQHYIPDDGFEHVKALDCPCQPEMVSMPSFGGGVSHRKMMCDDYFPERWIDNVDPR